MKMLNCVITSMNRYETDRTKYIKVLTKLLIVPIYYLFTSVLFLEICCSDSKTSNLLDFRYFRWRGRTWKIGYSKKKFFWEP